MTEVITFLFSIEFPLPLEELLETYSPEQPSCAQRLTFSLSRPLVYNSCREFAS